MDEERLRDLIDRFSSCRVAVIGDFFLDKYLDTDPTIIEKSVETGRNAHQVVAIRRSAGAAGTVVNNLTALGARTVHAIGAIGNDGEGYDLVRCLQWLGCNVKGLLQFDDLMTPTYLKPRNLADRSLAGEHERYDTKNRESISEQIVQRVTAALDDVLPQVDAVIIVDQVEEDDCGIITTSIRDILAVRALRYEDVIFWADSRTHIRLFRNIMIKPNQFEVVEHPNPLPEQRISLDRVRRAVRQLRSEIGAPVCVTLGARGMLVSDPELILIPTVSFEGPVDATGAGDSVTAGVVLAMASGASLPEAGLVGNLVASITVRQLATTGTARPQELVEWLAMWRSHNEFLEDRSTISSTKTSQ